MLYKKGKRKKRRNGERETEIFKGDARIKENVQKKSKKKCRNDQDDHVSKTPFSKTANGQPHRSINGKKAAILEGNKRASRPEQQTLAHAS